MIKYYDLTIQYHPGKANVIADALSRTGVPKICMSFIADLDRTGISLCYASVAGEETRLLIRSPLHEQVRVAQLHDRLVLAVRKRIEAGRPREFSMGGGCHYVFWRSPLCTKESCSKDGYF